MPHRRWLGVLLVLAAGALPARAQVSLGWKLEKDSEFDLVTLTTCDQTFTAVVEKPEYKRRTQVSEMLGVSCAGPLGTLPWVAFWDVEVHQAKHKTEQVTVLHYKVLEHNDKSIVLEQRILHMGIEIADRSAEERARIGTAALDEFYRRLDGTVFTLTLKPDLEVTDFKGYDELLRKVTGEDPHRLDVVAQGGPLVGGLGVVGSATYPGSPLTRTVKLVLPEEALRKSVRESLGHWPDHPVREGDTWEWPVAGKEEQESLGPLGSCRRKTRYKFEGQELYDNKTVQKISFTSTVLLTADKAPSGTLPFQVLKADLKAEDARGTIRLDEKTGRVLHAESHLTLQGPLLIALTGDSQPVRTWMRQEVTVRTELRRPPEPPPPPGREK